MRFNGVDLATSNLDGMVAFYRDVFGVEFNEEEYQGFRHAVGDLAGIRFMLAPSEPANVDEGTEGVHQFHLEVSDIAAVGARVEKAGLGSFESYNGGQGCVWDPDGNPWMLHEKGDG